MDVIVLVVNKSRFVATGSISQFVSLFLYSIEKILEST